MELELDAAAMRRMGERVVEILVERIAGLDAQPVWKGATREAMEGLLREPPPSRGRDFDEILDRLRRDVLDHAGRIDHPRFFAFVPSCPTWPGILGDFIAAGYDIFQGTWLESAGPSMLELVVLDWFREWLGYPAGAGGLLVSGGSAANLTAIACARETRLGEAWTDGVIYLSEQSHSSMARAARILGWPAAGIRTIPVDAGFRIRLDALRDAVREDRAAGRRPFLVCANAGGTSTGAVDPLREIASIAREERLWMHADAAYGGFAVLTDSGKAMLRGIEEADSVTLDPHKWLFQSYEAGCLMLRDETALAAAFHIMPDYLQDTAVKGGAVNFADRGIQLTRAARAIKIWLSIQSFGLDAFRAAIARGIELAAYAEERIRESRSLELLTPASLGIVCFRRTGAAADLDGLNERLTAALAGSGLGMISSTRVGGAYAMRLCIMNHRSRREDVDRVLDWLETAEV